MPEFLKCLGYFRLPENKLTMNFSLLLTGLMQRLVLVMVLLLVMWGVYVWATANEADIPNALPDTEQVTP